MNFGNTSDREGRFLAGLKKTLRLSLFLLVITAAAVLFLSLVNTWTAERIAEQVDEKHRASMEAVMPGANVFSELYTEDTSINGITGAYDGTRFMGYCVEVSSHGFGGEISLMVGIDESGSVTGVSILKHSETTGLGSGAETHDFLDQYIDMSGIISVDTGKNAIDAVTGATDTSKAVTSGVNTALTAVLNYNAEGGLFTDEREE